MIEEQVKDNQYGRFYRHATPTTEIINGKEVNSTRDAIFVEIMTKGTRNTFSREATEIDKKRWARSWADFEGKGGGMAGTPISALGVVGPSDEFKLNSLGIFTVEDLAELDEQAIYNSQIPAARALQSAAKAFFEARKAFKAELNSMESEPVETVQPENDIDESDPDVVQLEDTIEVKPRRGRPPKR